MEIVSPLEQHPGFPILTFLSQLQQEPATRQKKNPNGCFNNLNKCVSIYKLGDVGIPRNLTNFLISGSVMGNVHLPGGG